MSQLKIKIVLPIIRIFSILFILLSQLELQGQTSLESCGITDAMITNIEKKIDLDNAIFYLDSLSKLDPKPCSPNVLRYYQALIEYQLGSFEKSRTLLFKDLQDSTSSPADLRKEQLYLMCLVQYELNKYPESESYGRQALNIHPKKKTRDDELFLSNLYYAIANAISWQYEKENYLDEVIKYYTLSYETIEAVIDENSHDERYREAYKYIGSEQGLVTSITGNQVGAVRHIRNLIQKMNEMGLTDFEDHIDNFFTLGISYAKIGDYEAADLYHDKIIKYLENNPELKCSLQFGPKLNYKCLNCLWSGEYELGVEIGKRALVEDSCMVRAARSMSHNNIGHCYVELNDFENAITHLDSSIYLGTHPDTFLYNEGIPTRTKAILFNNFGKYEEARKLANYAMGLFKKANVEREFINVHRILGKSYLGLGMLDSSSYHLEKVLELLGYDSHNEYNNEPRNFADYIMWTLVDYSDLKDSLYLRSGKLEYLKEKHDILSNAFEILYYRISNINSYNSVLTFLDRYQSLTNNLIETCLSLHNKTEDSKYLIYALNVADRNKSSLSIRKNALSEIDLLGQEKLTTHEEWKLLNEEHRKIFNKTLSTSDTLELKVLKNELFELKNKITAQESKLKESNNFYKAIFDRVDYNQIIQSVKGNEANLLFYYGTSQLFAFIIKDQSLKVKTVDLNEIENILQLMTSGQKSKKLNDKSHLVLSQKLNEVFKDVFAETTKIDFIKVIPDGVLNLIPFEILEFENSMLLEMCNVSYAESLRINHLRANTRSNKKKNIACFAPSYSSKNDVYASALDIEIQQELERSGEYELPGAYKESKTISDIFNGMLFSDTEANEVKFMDQVENYNILHLAMHAYANHDKPSKSKLLFTQSETDSLEDNFLHAFEISNLNLNSDLVVLSACSTGNGKVRTGEGVQSLSKAFSAAGAKATVHSLWKVPDAATSYIMIEFYNNLKNGLRKDEALRQAKIKYLEDDAISSAQKDPYYWAGFVANGNMDPIKLDANSKILLYALLLAALLLIGRVMSKKSRRVNQAA